MASPKKSKLYTEAEVHAKLQQQMYKELLQNHFPKAVAVVVDGQTFYEAAEIDKGFKKLENDTVAIRTDLQNLVEELKEKGKVKF